MYRGGRVYRFHRTKGSPLPDASHLVENRTSFLAFADLMRLKIAKDRRRNGSLFTVCGEELVSATPDPETSPPSSPDAECMPKPTTDEEPETTTTDAPSLQGVSESPDAEESEPLEMSEQVRESWQHSPP